MLKNKFVLFSLLVIIILSVFVRVYKLTSVPPSLNWDEVAASYNAYTIKNWFRDEYGNFLPLVFKSFGDDKHPVHIYFTALVYTVFGVSDFTSRLSSVLISVGAVIGVLLYCKYQFKNQWIGLVSSLLIAISFYHIHYSRGLWEANFAISLFILAVGLFSYGVSKSRFILLASFGIFGLSLLSYHSSKVVVFPLVILLVILNFDKERINKYLLLGLAIFGLFCSLLVIEPRLLGIERAKQTRLDPRLVENTFLYKKTGNELLGRIEASSVYYKNYFTYNYLFEIGDQEPRGSANVGGQFYKFYVILAPLGFITLFIRRRFKELIFLTVWLLFAPIPAALAGANPNATRAIFMLGPLEILSAAGIGILISNLKSQVKSGFAFVILSLILAVSFYPKYLKYINTYPQEEAIQWQYGLKQAVEHVKDNPDYRRIYVTKIRSQPYIFFLNYLNVPLPELLASVKYDNSGSKSYNTIESFDKYNFGNWDYIESQPIDGILYILTQSEYTGLRHMNDFTIKQIINYPGGDVAFYLISSY